MPGITTKYKNRLDYKPIDGDVSKNDGDSNNVDKNDDDGDDGDGGDDDNRSLQIETHLALNTPIEKKDPR